MKSVVIVALFAVLMSGCATILTGTRQKVKFASDQREVVVEADGQACQLPCSLKLKRGEEHIVKFRKEGHETQTVVTQKKFNAVSILNLFGLIGWAVDAADGAMYSVEPESMNVRLRQAE